MLIKLIQVIKGNARVIELSSEFRGMSLSRLPFAVSRFTFYDSEAAHARAIADLSAEALA